jgi:hypothetical protein
MQRNSSTASWAIKDWPADVYPNKASRARRLIRLYETELLRESALVRVGREKVVIGNRYQRWLEKQGANVVGFKCPANKTRESLPTAGGAP